MGKLMDFAIVNHHRMPCVPTFPASRFLLEPESFRFPLVLKPDVASLGIGCSLIRRKEDLPESLSRLILQPFVAGVDRCVSVINYEAVACIQRTPADGDFRANVAQGASVIPIHEIETSVTVTAVKAAKALKAPVCCIDIILTGPEDALFLECNRNSTFEVTSRACSKDIKSLADRERERRGVKAAGLEGLDSVLSEFSFRIPPKILRAQVLKSGVVAFERGLIVGYATPHPLRVYVSKPFRRRGHARRMVEELDFPPASILDGDLASISLVGSIGYEKVCSYEDRSFWCKPR